jgi:cell division septal protein FtsQ
LNARSKGSQGKARPVQTQATAPEPENLRPAVQRWQKILLAVTTVLLATWLIVLVVMAWK